MPVDTRRCGLPRSRGRRAASASSTTLTARLPQRRHDLLVRDLVEVAGTTPPPRGSPIGSCEQDARRRPRPPGGRARPADRPERRTRRGSRRPRAPTGARRPPWRRSPRRRRRRPRSAPATGAGAPPSAVDAPRGARSPPPDARPPARCSRAGTRELPHGSLVEHHARPGATAPIASSGLPGAPSFRGITTSSGARERPRHGQRDRDAAPRDREHGGGARHTRAGDRLGERRACLVPIAEHGAPIIAPALLGAPARG